MGETNAFDIDIKKMEHAQTWVDKVAQAYGFREIPRDDVIASMSRWYDEAYRAVTRTVEGKTEG